MSKKPNTVIIGSFVVGALALAVVGILIIGGGKFFTTRDKHVMFFEGAAKGLNIGAPVDFKGVRVGSVTDIKLLFDRRDLSFRIMVLVETDMDKITEIHTENSEKYVEKTDTKTLVEAVISQGLRAQLGMQSLVTGQLYVALDFHPDKPARLFGLETGYVELPTIPSSLEQISKTMEKVPVEAIAQKLVSAVEGIERFINSPHTQEVVASFNGAAKEAQGLLHHVNSRIDPLASNLEKTLADAQKLMQDLDSQVHPVASDFKETVKQARLLITNTDKRLGPVASGMEETLKVARSAVKQAEDTLNTLDKAAGDNSAFRYELSSSLRELSSAARSIRYLADYLEQHPEALLKGKGKN